MALGSCMQCLQFAPFNLFYLAAHVHLVTYLDMDLKYLCSFSGACVFQIYFVDYGNEETLSVGSLLPLPKDLAVLPPQAICCSLARLEAPDDTDTEGKVRACDEMADVVADSVFFDLLMLGEYDRERGVLPVDLLLSHDANLPAEHSLSDLLVLGGVLKEVSDLPATVPLHPYSAFQPPPDAEFSMRVTCVDDCGHLYGYEIPSGEI